MAYPLMPCPDCGKQVSRRALMCPACGCGGEVIAAETPTAGFALRWQSAVGRTYSVYATPDLTSAWDAKPIAELQGTGDVLEYVPSGDGAAMFFKVTVRLSDGY